jgi:hypothetical protein
LSSSGAVTALKREPQPRRGRKAVNQSKRTVILVMMMMKLLQL